jgi:serine/threonine protein kinase
MIITAHLYCDHCGAANPLRAHFCFACGTALNEDGSPDKYATLEAEHLLKGRYQIIRRIGSGGYGKVYKAKDCQFGNRVVAIKEMIQQGLSAEERAKANDAFKHEAFLLAGLTHPNLPSIYDYFSEDDRSYLVMSFIEGETLLKYCMRQDKQRLPAEKVINIGIQLASVLSYLHTRKPPIIFRDLKPINVMRTPEGQIYLIDFGIARHFKPEQSKDTLVLGSPGYAAPEQYGRAQTTPQSDMYSLGATLHHLLSGENPALAPFRFGPLPLSDYPQLATLVTCMLDRDMKKRPASMSNVKRELQRMVNRGTHHHEASMRYVQPDASAIASSALVRVRAISERVALSHPLAVSDLAWSPGGQMVACAKGQDHVQLFDSSSKQPLPVRQLGPGIRVASVSWSLDSQQIACACNDGLVHILHRTGMENERGSAPYPAHASAVERVAWSPNGKYIASTANGAVHVWHAKSHNTIRIYREHQSPITSLSWSPDSWFLVSCGLDGHVRAWHAFSGRTVFDCPLDAVRCVAWSPDGRMLAAGSWHATHIWYLADGRLMGIYREQAQLITMLAWSPDGQQIASSSSDGTVHLWQPYQCKRIRVYQEHKEHVSAVAWSPQGSDLVSGDVTGALRFWR